MNDDPTREDMRASIVPKSDQLNADDLISGPITVTITAVRKGDREQPIIVEIDGHQPYKPCKSMRRVLIATYSDNPKQWVGKRMTLYCDPNVTWAGLRVGGIRISHVSGIDEPKVYLITQTRGKRSEVTILPLDHATAAELEYIEDARGEIARASTNEMLKAIGFILATKTKVVQDALRDEYAAKQQDLRSRKTGTGDGS